MTTADVNGRDAIELVRDMLAQFDKLPLLQKSAASLHPTVSPFLARARRIVEAAKPKGENDEWRLRRPPTG